MSGNLLRNAGFLDGYVGWEVISGATLAVDEATRGAPGRAALVSIKTLAAGARLELGSVVAGAADVTQGEVLEVRVRAAAVGSVAEIGLAICDSGGAALARTPLLPVASSGRAPRRGLPSTFDTWAARVTALASGKVRFEAAAIALAPGAVELVVVKPFVARARADGRAIPFDPGSHAPTDMQLPIWPAELPPFRSGGLAQPVANAKSFATDAGIPVREDLYSGLHQEFRGQLRCDDDAFDRLSDFYDAERGEFYVVRPDTDQLCVAEWLADGAPKVTGVNGPWSIVEVGLHLRVA